MSKSEVVIGVGLLIIIVASVFANQVGLMASVYLLVGVLVITAGFLWALVG